MSRGFSGAGVVPGFWLFGPFALLCVAGLGLFWSELWVPSYPCLVPIGLQVLLGVPVSVVGPGFPPYSSTVLRCLGLGPPLVFPYYFAFLPFFSPWFLFPRLRYPSCLLPLPYGVGCLGYCFWLGWLASSVWLPAFPPFPGILVVSLDSLLLVF